MVRNMIINISPSFLFSYCHYYSTKSASDVDGVKDCTEFINKVHHGALFREKEKNFWEDRLGGREWIIQSLFEASLEA